MSLPTRGEWIEILFTDFKKLELSLSPHGESGLKYPKPQLIQFLSKSLPTRGEWIEILFPAKHMQSIFRLSPHGESGLKCHSITTYPQTSVSPHTGRVD